MGPAKKRKFECVVGCRGWVAGSSKKASVLRRFGVVYKVERIHNGFNSVCGRWVRKRVKSCVWVLGGLGVYEQYGFV